MADFPNITIFACANYLLCHFGDQPKFTGTLHENDRALASALRSLLSDVWMCLRYHPNVEIAMDILQDGFIKVFENISFRFEGSIEGWIRRIIINTALEYHRKIKDEKMVDLSDALLLSQEPLSVDIDYRQLLC